MFDRTGRLIETLEYTLYKIYQQNTLPTTHMKLGIYILLTQFQQTKVTLMDPETVISKSILTNQYCIDSRFFHCRSCENDQGDDVTYGNTGCGVFKWGVQN